MMDGGDSRVAELVSKPSSSPTQGQQPQQEEQPNPVNPGSDLSGQKQAQADHGPGSIIDLIHTEMANRGATHLLTTLPPVEEMTFHYQEDFPGATPAKLYMGNHGGTHVFAYMFQYGDKPREIRFYGETDGQLDTRQILVDGGLKRFTLVPPFDKIFGEGTTVERRALSIFVKWYFLNGGYFSDRIGGGLEDYCYRMYLALEKLNKVTLRGPRRPEPKVMSPEAPAVSDQVLVREWLAKSNDEHLLDMLSGLEVMLFKDQTLLDKAPKMKLFIGTNKDDATQEIYAYLRKQGSNKYHEVSYYLEGAGGRAPPVKVLPDFVINSCILIEPFKWVATTSGQPENARMSAILKYYFSMANVISGVCEETKNFPYRIQDVLKFMKKNRERKNGNGTGSKIKGTGKSTKSTSTSSAAPDTPTPASKSTAKGGKALMKSLFHTASSSDQTTDLAGTTTTYANLSEGPAIEPLRNSDFSSGGASQEVTYPFGNLQSGDAEMADAPLLPFSDDTDHNINGQVEAQIQQDISGSVRSASKQSIHTQPDCQTQTDFVASSGLQVGLSSQRESLFQAGLGSQRESLSQAGSSFQRESISQAGLGSQRESLSKAGATPQAHGNSVAQMLDLMRDVSTPQPPRGIGLETTPASTITLTHRTPPSSRKRTAEDLQFEEMQRLYSVEGKLTQEINDLDEQVELLQVRREALHRQRIEHRAKIFNQSWFPIDANPAKRMCTASASSARPSSEAAQVNCSGAANAAVQAEFSI